MAQDVAPDQYSNETSHETSQNGHIDSNLVERSFEPSVHNGNGKGKDDGKRKGDGKGKGDGKRKRDGKGKGTSASNGDVQAVIAPNPASVLTSDFSFHSPPTQPVSSPSTSGPLAGKWGVLIGLGIGLVVGVGVVPRLANSDATQTNSAPESSLDATAEPEIWTAVTVTTVQPSQISRTLNATGTVVASDLLPILAKASGLQIQQVLVDEGDRITTGQPLVLLDQSVIRTQIAGAEADLEAALARVTQRQAALAQAKARLSEAQANLGRYQDLANQGAVSEEELDTRITTAATAQEDIRVAEANISSAQADVRSEEARIQQLQTQLGQAVVTAPASGIVAERFARVGDITSGSQSLFTVIRDNRLELDVDVQETELPSIQVGNTVAIRSDADPQLRLQGRVREILPLIDPNTRKAIVKISLPDSLKLRSGMFLKAILTTDTVQGVTIPSAAVLPLPDDSALVYRLGDSNQVQAQEVELGELLDDVQTNSGYESNTDRIEILKGLQEGDRVVLEGAAYLKDGDRVEVVEN